jgi:hypothetical protein
VPSLIHQPESVLIFERISSDPFTLREEWEGQLPVDELDALEAIWGRDGGRHAPQQRHSLMSSNSC